MRAYVGLGANLGDADTTLAEAVRALDRLTGARVAAVSPLYATAAVGVADQPEFRNAVVALDVAGADDPAAAALQFLAELKRLERTFGRRPGPRWGPRALDLDLLVFGRAQLALQRPPEGLSLDAAIRPDEVAGLLVVPHREAHERLFVLAPMADIAPRLVPPGWGETVASARRRREAIEGDDVRQIAPWDRRAGRWRMPRGSPSAILTAPRPERREAT